MNEGEFYTDHLRPQLKRWGAAWDRIENLMSLGIPDLNLSIGDRQAWIELKITHAQKLYFEKLQLPWFHQRLRQSHLGFWILAANEKANTVYLYHPKTCLEAPKTKVGKWTVVHLGDLVPTVVGPPPIVWSQVKNAILA